jgi:hypothetical protein
VLLFSVRFATTRDLCRFKIAPHNGRQIRACL